MPFEIVNQNEYLLVKLKGEVGNEQPNMYDALGDVRQKTQLKYVVLQCSEAGIIHPLFLRQCAQIYKDLKTVNGQVRLVAANDSIIGSIKDAGLDRILLHRMSLRGALVDFGLMKQKEFDVNFINPFLNATQKVLKVQCFLETKADKPFIKKPTDPLLLGDVSGIISITSETFSGTLAISLPEKIFLKIAKNMLGEDIPTITEENVDLVGELANMILGQAKIELASLGYSVQMALPSCVWGKDHKIKHFGGGVCVVIPFVTSEGTFYSEVMTSNNLGQEAKKAA